MAIGGAPFGAAPIGGSPNKPRKAQMRSDLQVPHPLDESRWQRAVHDMNREAHGWISGALLALTIATTEVLAQVHLWVESLNGGSATLQDTIATTIAAVIGGSGIYFFVLLGVKFALATTRQRDEARILARTRNKLKAVVISNTQGHQIGIGQDRWSQNGIAVVVPHIGLLNVKGEPIEVISQLWIHLKSGSQLQLDALSESEIKQLIKPDEWEKIDKHIRAIVGPNTSPNYLQSLVRVESGLEYETSGTLLFFVDQEIVERNYEDRIDELLADPQKSMIVIRDRHSSFGGTRAVPGQEVLMR